MPDNNLQVLHKTVSKDYGLGSFQKFFERMQIPENREAFFNDVSEEYNLGTFDDFEKRISNLGLFPQFKPAQSVEIDSLRPRNEIDDTMDALIAGKQQRVTEQETRKVDEGQFTGEMEILKLQNPLLYKEINKMAEEGESPDLIKRFISAKAASTKVAEKKPPVKPKQETIKQEEIGVLEATGKGLVSGSMQTAGSVGTGMQYTGGKLGLDTLEKAGKETHEYWEKRGEKHLPPEYLQGSIVDNPKLLLKGTWWAYNTAQMVPSFIAAMVPAVGTYKYINLLGKTMKFTSPLFLRLARLAPAIVGGVSGGSLEGSSTYQEIIDKGGSKEEAEAGMELMTLAAGSLNALSLNVMLKKMPPGLKSAITKYLVSGATEGFTEWAEEPSEAIIKMGLGFSTPKEAWEQTKAGINVAPIAALTGTGGAVITQNLPGVAVEEEPEITPEAPVTEAPQEPPEVAKPTLTTSEAKKVSPPKPVQAEEGKEVPAEMTTEEIKSEFEMLNKKEQAEIKRLDKLDPHRQITTFQHLSDKEFIRRSDLGSELQRRETAEARKRIEKKKAEKGKETVLTKIKKRGRAYDVVKKPDGSLILRSKTDVLPYSYQEYDKYINRVEAGRKAIKTKTEGKTIFKPEEFDDQPALSVLLGEGMGIKTGVAGEFRISGELKDLFDGVLVGTSKVNAKPPMDKNKSINEDNVVESFNQTMHDYHNWSESQYIETFDELVQIAHGELDEMYALHGRPKFTMEESEEFYVLKKSIGMTDDEYIEYRDAPANEKDKVIERVATSNGIDYIKMLEELKENERDITKQDEEEIRTVLKSEADDLELTEEEIEKNFQEAYEYFKSKITPATKPLKKLKANLTEVMFDTKDARTGEEIKAGEKAWRIEDTGEFLKESTYKGITERPEQEALFAEEVAKRAVEKPEAKPITINQYIKKIKDIGKKSYAVAYRNYILGKTKRPNIENYYISAKDRQDVEININEILKKKKPTEKPKFEEGLLKAEEGQIGIPELYGQKEFDFEKPKGKPSGSALALERPPEKQEPLKVTAWGIEQPFEPETTEKINKTQILTWTEKAFKVPIKSKVTHKWKHAGVYYPQKAIVRMEKWGELAVMSHEVAHHLDYSLKDLLGKGWRTELAEKGKKKPIIKELADLDYKQGKTGRRTREGFAEFMRHYLTTGKAKKLAPKFYELFTEDFLQKHPDIETKLSELKGMMDTWQKQGAETRIIQQIDFKGEHTKTIGFKSKFKKAKEWILRNFNDEFVEPQKIVKEIEGITGKKLKPTQNPAAMMEYNKAKAGLKARTFVLEKAIDEYGNIVGKGLVEIIKPIPNKQMKTFIAYGVAKRAEILFKRGVESGIDIDDARFITDKYKNETWDKAVNEITDWSNHLLDWVIRAGGLGEEEARVIRRLNPIYLPFKRAFIDELTVYRGTGRFVDTGQAIKRIKGSGRPLINPIEALISMANEMISKAQKIKIASLWAELASEKKIGGFITKVPAPISALQAPLRSIKDFENILYELGLLEPGVTTDLNLDKMATVFFQNWRYMGKENVVSIWRKGKREFYELHPELYRALSGMDMVRLPGIVRIVFSRFARMARLGATGIKVSFGTVKNPFRDAFTYAVFSKRKGAIPIVDSATGLVKELTVEPGELIWRFKKAGGSLSGMIGLDRAATMSTYDDLLLEKLGKKGKVLKVVRHPINALRDLLSLSEMAPRSIELEKSYEKYKKEKTDWSDEDCYVQAFLDAQDVTINFTKSGSTAKVINEIVPFFNVSIRGPEKLHRSIKYNTVNTIIKGIGYLTIYAMLNHWKNRDKDWYKNLPPAYKYNNFFFEMPGTNQVIRLPIPFELGIIFCSVPMATMDYMLTRNPEYLKGLIEQLKFQIPPITPAIIGPAYDVARNKTWLGTPIESEGMKYLPPAERARYYTTRTAKVLSRGFNKIGWKLSPVQIDYLLEGYTGGALKQIPGRKISEPADLPVLTDLLLRMPDNPRRQLNEFFSDWELLSQRKQAGISTKEERLKLAEIQPVYNVLSKLRFRKIKKYREAENIDKIKEEYRKIGELLKKHGYE